MILLRTIDWINKWDNQTKILVTFATLCIQDGQIPSGIAVLGSISATRFRDPKSIIAIVISWPYHLEISLISIQTFVKTTIHDRATSPFPEHKIYYEDLKISDFERFWLSDARFCASLPLEPITTETKIVVTHIKRSSAFTIHPNTKEIILNVSATIWWK